MNTNGVSTNNGNKERGGGTTPQMSTIRHKLNKLVKEGGKNSQNSVYVVYGCLQINKLSMQFVIYQSHVVLLC